jgi:hypothetical protein
MKKVNLGSYRRLDRKIKNSALAAIQFWRSPGRVAIHPALELAPNSPIARGRKREFIDLKALMLVPLSSDRVLPEAKTRIQPSKGGAEWSS